jgi:hypothetical protein
MGFFNFWWADEGACRGVDEETMVQLMGNKALSNVCINTMFLAFS